MAKRSLDTLFELPDLEPSGPSADAAFWTLSTINQTSVEDMVLPLLLAEAHILKQAADRLTAVKARIVELVQTEGLVSESGTLGARYQGNCAIVRYQNGRKTFNRELAVEAGVTPDQIEASMKEGKGGWVCELPSMELPEVD